MTVMPESEDFKKVLDERLNHVPTWTSGALRSPECVLRETAETAVQVADAFYFSVVDLLETENARLRKELYAVREG